MRTRTPTDVLELRGTFLKNPKRKLARAGEPKVKDKLGGPPGNLNAHEKAAWNQMREKGFWLTSADQFMVEVAAGLMAMHRSNEIDNPARSLLVSTLAKLGFGPSERSKINVPGAPDEKTGFAAFE